jgi:2-methylisocitrate lyase-like PEP mutase family enzyme
LRLANCWDAGSARLIETLGAKALATTSAGVAWAQGYPDGDKLPVDRLLDVVRSIARVVKIPLSVDIESGYSESAMTVAKTVARLHEVGAVGINIEDGKGLPALLADKIAQIKAAAPKVFVNARTDVYLAELAPPPERLAETLRRAKIYRDAGADGLFVPKLVNPEEIREVAAQAGLPLNVLAWPGLPSDLETLGVRRLSAGSAISQSAWTHVAEAAGKFLGTESKPQTYASINALF